MTDAPPTAAARGRATIHRGVPLREAVSTARAMGCEAEVARRTGDLLFRHPRMPRPCRVNCRRKDTSRALLVWLRHLVDLLDPL